MKVKSFRELKKVAVVPRAPMVALAPKVVVKAAPLVRRYGVCPDCELYHQLGADGSGCAKAVCEKMGLPYIPPAQRKNWSKSDVQVRTI